ncbi:flagellar biosynthetic protein FliR [Azohydromonas caseinilytica]|uniref:Flagellar biosynthetic protein FliR n=1 Tax=Azohydromonas caseinilytica TaxID=2728836 RepID=A0A848F5H5_9BURK|nr:flagellar biosynthetic protein FliR [Azohydromonas caseinilytica]NML14854.1 flagellar biosynthetic protein FliR [Azohydromonas caseinilytica]
MITFTEAQLLQWLTPLLWPLLRALALLSAMPVLGTRMVPARVRVGLALLLALAAQAGLPPMAPVPLDSPLAVTLVVQQLLVGITLGFAVRIVFAAVEFAGEVMGLQMGLNFAGYFDPVSASAGTATGRLFGTLVAWLFVVVNGHLVVLAALVRSFEAFPVGDQPFAFLVRLQPHAWGTEIFTLGLWIALPMIAMLLFVNLVLGVISRVASQLNVFSIGFPITLGVGLLGMLATLPLLEQPFMLTLERMLARFQ